MFAQLEANITYFCKLEQTFQKLKDTTIWQLGIMSVFTDSPRPYFGVIFSMFCIEQAKMSTKSHNLGATERGLVVEL